MHKIFYASGFLYHSPTQQILLQQNINNATPFSLFSGNSHSNEDEKTAFQRIIHESLKIKIPLKAIHPIYDYFYKDVGKNHFIVYGEVPELTLGKEIEEKQLTKWFSAKQLSKLKLPEQIYHDIIVGQRVIRAAEASDQKENIEGPNL